MIYIIVKFICLLYYKMFFNFTVVGVENVPRNGAAVLCSNHISNYDPVTMAVFIKRLPCYIAKKELFNSKLLGSLLTKLKAIPIDRSINDLGALKTGIKCLKNGELLGIFAQGTRVKEGEEKAAKAGVALFALKGNAPIIPVSISGNYKLFSQMTIVYGEPMELSEFRNNKLTSETLDTVAGLVMEKINELKTN